MNANELALHIAVDDYRRLERRVAHQAFMDCDHRHKWAKDCAKNGECYEQGILNFRFGLMVREMWN